MLRETKHRPWVLPAQPWLMGQTWIDLLFAHWEVPQSALKAVMPSQLPLDLYDGSAWIGVTPFVVRGLRLRGMPPLPYVSSFPELNVRTYVVVDDKPGIYFFSLDADSSAAVTAARRSFRLSYFKATMSKLDTKAGTKFVSERTSADGEPAQLRARYGGTGKLLPIHDGSLERWLTERYCLYTLDDEQRVQRADIHHPPWPLEEARAEIELNTMTHPLAIELTGPPTVHLARRQDVVIWPIRPAV